MKTIRYKRNIFSSSYDPGLLHKKGSTHKTWVHQLDNTDDYLIIYNRLSPSVNGIILRLKIDFEIL